MTQILEKARDFATTAHAGQTRKDAARSPYITHIEEVASLVEAWGGDEIAICAAFLHDTVEDCDVTPADLTALFGAEVTRVVQEVTDDKTLPNMSRKGLQIKNAPRKSARAALLKLADKTSNVRDLTRAPSPDWDDARRCAYAAHACAVVMALPQDALPAEGLVAFHAAAARILPHAPYGT